MPVLSKPNIIRILKDKGKNQTGAGKAIGINQGAFSARLNSGQFTDDEVEKLANYLGVSTKEVLKANVPDENPSDTGELIIKIHLSGDQKLLNDFKLSLNKLMQGSTGVNKGDKSEELQGLDRIQVKAQSSHLQAGKNEAKNKH